MVEVDGVEEPDEQVRVQVVIFFYSPLDVVRQAENDRRTRHVQQRPLDGAEQLPTAVQLSRHAAERLGEHVVVLAVTGGEGLGGNAGMGVIDVAATDRQHCMNDVIRLVRHVIVDLVEETEIPGGARSGAGIELAVKIRGDALGEAGGEQRHFLAAGTQRVGQFDRVAFGPSPGWIRMENDQSDLQHPTG